MSTETWSDERIAVYEAAEQEAIDALVGASLIVEGKRVRVRHAVVLIEDLEWEDE